MKEENIEKVFKHLEGSFDVNSPNEGHHGRFLEKLNMDNTNLQPPSSKNHWKPLIAIAASLLICFAVFAGLNKPSNSMDLASVSPELSKTQDFFTVTISEELKKLDAERSPLTNVMINDAMQQLAVLEDDYKNLKTDLSQSNDNRVIYAMVSNFQNRIDVLTEVLDKIEDLKDLKNNKNDYENTL
jgi:biopolymer transport protein ExbD